MGKKEKHFWVEDDIQPKTHTDAVIQWWCNLTDKARMKIIKEAYENW